MAKLTEQEAKLQKCKAKFDEEQAQGTVPVPPPLPPSIPATTGPEGTTPPTDGRPPLTSVPPCPPALPSDFWTCPQCGGLSARWETFHRQNGSAGVWFRCRRYPQCSYKHYPRM